MRNHPGEELRAALAGISPTLVELDREGVMAILMASRRTLRRQRIGTFLLASALLVPVAGAGLLCGLAM